MNKVNRKKIAKINVNPRTLGMLRRMYEDFRENADDEEGDSADIPFERFVELMVLSTYQKHKMAVDKELFYIG
jgi:hypothetical protein